MLGPGEVGKDISGAAMFALVRTEIRRIEEMLKRGFEIRGHFDGVGREARPARAVADPRRNQIIARANVPRRQRAEQFDRRAVVAQFFMKFAERGGGGAFARLDRAAGKTDLTGMHRRIGRSRR